MRLDFEDMRVRADSGNRISEAVGQGKESSMSEYHRNTHKTGDDNVSGTFVCNSYGREFKGVLAMVLK